MLKNPYEFNYYARDPLPPYKFDLAALRQAVNHCQEELEELEEAMKMFQHVVESDRLAHQELRLEGAYIDLMDAAIDLRYVAGNVLWALGVPLADGIAAEDMVHGANMAKLVPCPATLHGEDCCKGNMLVAVKNEDGKVMKPKGWSPPDWDEFFKNVRWVYDRSLLQLSRGEPKSDL